MLARLLELRGIESVVLELRSREYVEERVRAGVLEQRTVDLLTEAGVADRLHREGMVHEGIELRFGGRGHRIDLSGLTGGRTITVYGQQEVVKDLIAARLESGGELHFEVADVAVADVESERPAVRFTPRRRRARAALRRDRGLRRLPRRLPPGDRGRAERVRARVPLRLARDPRPRPPSSEELIYANHAHGFALHSMRTPEIMRLYLQCEPDEDLDEWPDERVWSELQTRFELDEGFRLNEGDILDKGVTPMRSFVVEPMQHGRLFLAGDAAHIVPPTGAKGLNTAVADVELLAEALEAFYGSGDTRGLDGYSERALRRVWRVEHFSSWMTSMLHRPPGQDPFEAKLQRSQLEYVCSSQAASTTLAENYVGLERI